MTAVDVDALDKLREAATAGPWDYGITGIYTDRLAEVGQVGSTDDAALIVAAVNALPDLLAEVRRGRALREAVEGLAAELDANGRQREALGKPAWPLNIARDLHTVLAAVDGGGQQ